MSTKPTFGKKLPQVEIGPSHGWRGLLLLLQLALVRFNEIIKGWFIGKGLFE
jgi:hypothetical protein